MIDQHLVKCLETIEDEKSLMTVYSIIKSSEDSDLAKLIRALSYHLVRYNLRLNESGEISLGRIQGLQAYVDFLEAVIVKAEDKPEEPTKKEEEPSGEKPDKYEGGYGAV